jgi:hypothetical protein
MATERPRDVNSKLLGLLATLLIPALLPVLIGKAGIRVPARKWAVWYIFWIVLASLIAWQIFTIEHILHVEPTHLEFGEDANERQLLITNNGTGVIRWEIRGPGLDWVEFRPDSDAVGAEEDVVKVVLNRSAVPAGRTVLTYFVVGREGENQTVTVGISG